MSAPHLSGALELSPDALVGLQLSRTTHRAEGEGPEEHFAHLELRTRRGLRVRVSATAPEAELEGLPWMARYGARVDFATLKSLFSFARSSDVPLARWDDHSVSREAEPVLLEPPGLRDEPVLWPPDLKPPPPPPSVWHAIHTDAVTGLAFTLDSEHLLSAGWEGNLCLWSMRHGREVEVIPTSLLRGVVAASPVDPEAFAWVDRGESIGLRGDAGARVFEDPHIVRVRALTFSPDGAYLLAACRVCVVVARVSDGETTHVAPIADEAWSLCFGAYDRLYVGGRAGRVTSCAFDGGEVEVESTLEIGEGRVYALSFDHSHRTLGVLRMDRALVLYDLDAGEVTATMSKPPPTALCYTSRGTLVTGHNNGAVLLWGDEGHQVIARLPVRVRAVCASADGYWIAAGDDMGHVALWDVVRERLYRH